MILKTGPKIAIANPAIIARIINPITTIAALLYFKLSNEFAINYPYSEAIKIYYNRDWFGCQHYFNWL